MTANSRLNAARRLGAPATQCDRCGEEFVFDADDAVWVRFWTLDQHDEDVEPKLLCSVKCATEMVAEFRLDSRTCSIWEGDTLRAELEEKADV